MMRSFCARDRRCNRSYPQGAPHITRRSALCAGLGRSQGSCAAICRTLFVLIVVVSGPLFQQSNGPDLPQGPPAPRSGPLFL